MGKLATTNQNQITEIKENSLSISVRKHKEIDFHQGLSKLVVQTYFFGGIKKNPQDDKEEIALVVKEIREEMKRSKYLLNLSLEEIKEINQQLTNVVSYFDPDYLECKAD